MKQGFLIFNPSAGQKAKSKSLVSTVIRQFERNGIDITPSPTEPDGSVIHQVRQLLQESPDLLVAWGGDGTINEVVNGMFGSNVPLGILPGGTANLCVRELHIPRNSVDAIQVISKGNTRTVSVGQANQRYFLLMVGIGFDSEVIKNVDWNLKRKLGTFAFGISAFWAAQNYDFPKFQIHLDREEKECVFAVISNAREYGAYFILTPEANISDEFFHVCLFKEPGILSMSRYAFHAFRRTHNLLPSVEVFRATELEATGPERIAVQADGELIGHLPVKLKIHPHSLNVFSP
jgi:YegS/Rv2252/BmrU family lipid kinase